MLNTCTKPINACWNTLCLNRVSNALQPNLPYYVVYFLDFYWRNVVYYIIVQLKKTRLYLCVGGDYFEFEGQI